MKQTLFETRERANELLTEALEIWRQSDHSESLEGIEKDPVFSLLINALAYQENEIESEIFRLRQEIIEDLTRLMTPFEAGHPIPASAVIETAPENSIAEVEITDNSVFKLDGNYSFIPLFKSKVINAEISLVERLDGRRWKVELSFRHPVKNLSGFSFATQEIDYKNLSIKIQGGRLHLIRPWNYTELPFAEGFDPNSLIYNHGEYFSGSMLPMDIFVSQNVRMFWIDNFESTKLTSELTKIDLIFEFSGIEDDFIFDSSKLVLNPVFLVNAEIKEVTLSANAPIVRIAGFSEDSRDKVSNQFLQLIRPSSTQMFSNTAIEVRRVSGDRFNQGALLKLLTSIVNKYHTDFYAYQHLEEMKSDRLIYNLQELIARMIKVSQKDYLRNMAGVYLLLHERKRIQDSNFSIEVKYLTTSGAGVNNILKAGSVFQVPGNLSQNLTRLIGEPFPGSDEVESESLSKSLLRYYMLTGDRIVTPADIKLFCLTMLQRRYGLSGEMIISVKVDQRQTQVNYGPGYEICADITLLGSPIVKRSLGDKVPLMEIILQKMIEVRTIGIYPIRVTISFSSNE